MSEACVLAIDFDGTVVTNDFEYPEFGAPIGAEMWLKLYVGMGAKLILWTCRSGLGLDYAKTWFISRDIPIWAVNRNPTDIDWFVDAPGPKPHADLYVDDKTIGMPLVYTLDGKSYVDWALVGPRIEAFVMRRINEEKDK